MNILLHAGGIGTHYELDGPGIESLPIPVAERSKTKRLLVRIPPGAWMFVLYVLYDKDKRQS